MWHRVGTVAQFIKKLMAENPKMPERQAKAIATRTTRVRVSRYYKVHYGTQAAARNLRHMAAGTHGL